MKDSEALKINCVSGRLKIWNFKSRKLDTILLVDKFAFKNFVQ